MFVNANCFDWIPTADTDASWLSQAVAQSRQPLSPCPQANVYELLALHRQLLFDARKEHSNNKLQNVINNMTEWMTKWGFKSITNNNNTMVYNANSKKSHGEFAIQIK